MLYIMRHGTTDWNQIEKLQGRTDIPLNEKGRKMAEQAAVEYEKLHFDLCYASPLKRALETAEIVLKDREVPIFIDDRLVEMCFGIWEGRTGYFQTEEYPIHLLYHEPENYLVPVEGGESMAELFARTGAFLDEKVYPLLAGGKDILIVGHGVMNCSILCQVRNLPVSEFWSEGIPQCRIIRLL